MNNFEEKKMYPSYMKKLSHTASKDVPPALKKKRRTKQYY